MSNRERLQKDNDDLMNIYNTAVNLPKYVNTSEANALAGDILSGKTAYVNSQKIIGVMSNLGDIDITPNVGSQLYNGGYYNSINVLPVNSTIDNNITPENIANGVNILGVVGTLSGSEDLSNELNAQNLVISNLENQINVLSDQLNNAAGLPPSEIIFSANTKVTFYNSTFTELPSWIGYNSFSLQTSMYGMFDTCNRLITVPNFNTSNITNMSRMFAGCEKLTSISNFDTSNVTSMSWMFAVCRKLNVPQLNTAKVKNMECMFRYCNNLSNDSIQNIINMCLNSNVTNSAQMNLRHTNYNSPLNGTDVYNSRYQNRWDELTAAGWSY